MAISHVLKRHKWSVCILLSITFIIGGIMMFEYFNLTKEEQRNRDYEVSLVNALKNSYEGIEEIRITDPYYRSIPGHWTCNIKIKFKNGKTMSYGISHTLDQKQNYDGAVEGETDEEINNNWEQLHSQKGKTDDKVKVIYSNQEKGEQ